MFRAFLPQHRGRIKKILSFRCGRTAIVVWRVDDGPPGTGGGSAGRHFLHKERDMQKLKLDLDEVEVTTFAAEDAPAPPPEGTVVANTTVDACYPTLVRPPTCDC
jgi:hypothetical protein